MPQKRRRSSAFESAVTSFVPNITCPVTFAPAGRQPKSACPSVDFPLPLSPMMAVAPPGKKSALTSESAAAPSRADEKHTDRLRTENPR